MKSKSIQLQTSSITITGDSDTLFLPLTLSNLHIPNRSLAWSLSLSENSCEEADILAAQVQRYNAYLEQLLSAKDFISIFKASGFSLSQQQMQATWGTTYTEKVFALETFSFSTPFAIQNGYFFATAIEPKCQVILDGQSISFTLGASDVTYPREITLNQPDGEQTKSNLLWNWNDNHFQDFTFYLWSICEDYNLLPSEEDSFGDLIQDYSVYEYYNEHKGQTEDTTPLSNCLLNCLEILQDNGYFTVYQVTPASYNPWFYYRSNGSVDIGILKMTFLDNQTLINKIKAILKGSAT